MVRILLSSLLGLTGLVLFSQDTVRVPTTNFRTVLPDGFSIEGPAAILTHPDFLTTIMEMPGADFSLTLKDSDHLRQEYADSGVEIESFRRDTRGGTSYLYLQTGPPRRVYQIMFGDERYSAIATMEPVGGAPIDTAAAQRLIHGLAYLPSEADPLQEHARFTLDRTNFGYAFKSYMNMMFGFEAIDGQSMLLVMQVPVAMSDEALATQLITGMTAKGITLTTLEAGEATIGPFTGYRLLATPSTPEQAAHIKWMGVFATSNAETQLLFQLMQKDEAEDPGEVLAELLGHFGWR